LPQSKRFFYENEDLLAKLVEMKGFTHLMMLALAAGVASAERKVERFARRDPADCQHGTLSPHLSETSGLYLFGELGLREVTVDAHGTWHPKGKDNGGDDTVTVTVGADQAAQTVTTTIFENIFVDCSIERGKTKCTPVSTVTVDGFDASATPQHQGHGKNKGQNAPAPPAPVAPAPPSKNHGHGNGEKKGTNAPANAPAPAPKGHDGACTKNDGSDATPTAQGRGHGKNKGQNTPAPPPPTKHHGDEKGEKKGTNAPAPVVAPAPAAKGGKGHHTKNEGSDAAPTPQGQGHGKNKGQNTPSTPPPPSKNHGDEKGEKKGTNAPAPAPKGGQGRPAKHDPGSKDGGCE